MEYLHLTPGATYMEAGASAWAKSGRKVPRESCSMLALSVQERVPAEMPMGISFEKFTNQQATAIWQYGLETGLIPGGLTGLLLSWVIRQAAWALIQLLVKHWVHNRGSWTPVAEGQA